MNFLNTPDVSANEKRKIFHDFHRFVALNLDFSAFSDLIYNYMTQKCGFPISNSKEDFYANAFKGSDKAKITFDIMIQKVPFSPDPCYADLNSELACMFSDYYSDCIK